MHNRQSTIKHKQWRADDKEFLWHPFTQMRDWMDEEPLVIDKAEGFNLIDVDGREYIDGHSSLWVNIHGHGHPTIVEAVRTQIAKLDHSTMLGLGSTPSIELAKKLAEITPPGLTRTFYSDSGSTAVEIALKMSFQYWKQIGQQQRTRFLTFEGAYHGDTVGSVSVGGIGLFHEIFHPLLFKTIQSPFPYAYRSDAFRDNVEEDTRYCLEALETLLKQHAHELCAVVAEPGLQGANGIHTASSGFLGRVRELTQQYDVHLIVDEVATGFGRTGAMFACEAEQVSPDFMCLAKGITGGVLPLAATLTTEQVFDAFLGSYEEYKSFFHGHSYTGNPVACAAALANLKLFESNNLIESMQAHIASFGTALQRLEDHPFVGEVRRKGWMTGIELVKNRSTREIWDPADKVPQKIVEEARKMGAIIRPLGNVMVLMPAPAMDGHTATRLVDITERAISAVTMGAS